MNKQCKACGANVPNEARFCQKCGASDFMMFEPEQTNVLDSTYVQYNIPPVANSNNQYDTIPPAVNQNTQYQNIQYQNYQQAPEIQQNWQTPVQPIQPKKKKTGLIIGIVVGVIAFFVVLGIIGAIASQNDSYYDDYYSDDYYADDYDTVEYTKGYFDGTTYINEWADISLELPEGFVDTDYDTYSSMENATTECGAYFMAEDTSSVIIICFEELPSFPVYNETSYLDVSMSNLEAEVDVYYYYDDYYTTTIAGYDYTTVTVGFDNGYAEVVESVYVRQIGDYMVFISAVSLDEATNDALVSMISNAY